MAADSIECPECGETIGSEEQVDVEEVKTISRPSTGGLRFGDASQNLYRCKKCRAILGVRHQPSE